MAVLLGQEYLLHGAIVSGTQTGKPILDVCSLCLSWDGPVAMFPLGDPPPLWLVLTRGHSQQVQSYFLFQKTRIRTEKIEPV